jgi:HAE1 family hydrophobic/amphiphilic exporter-1
MVPMSLLARASLKNRALIVLITVVAAVFGTVGIGQLKQELMPSVQFPMVAVVTTYPGATPEVVNTDVSKPIETALRGVPDLKDTSATSASDSSMVLAEFEYGTDTTATEQKVERAISKLDDKLPDSADWQVVSGSIDDFPVIQIAASGPDGTDPEQTADRLDKVLVPKLEDVDGVREAQLTGARGDRISIKVDKDKLEDEGLSAESVKDALEQNGNLIPAGSLTDGDDTLNVQTGSKLTSLDAIKKLPLVPDAQTLQQQQQQEQQQEQAEAQAEAAAGGGAPDAAGAEQSDADQSDAEGEDAEPLDVVTISDVASVKKEKNPETSISRVNGAPAITIGVTKVSDANTVDVSHDVQRVLDDNKDALNDIQTTVVFDQAPYIEQSIETLTTEGLLGLVFAVIVILVFLFSIRATLVTAISIPTSVLLALIGLWSADYTLNMLTLGALTISIGRVVDDSIVVIENIQRHLKPGVDRFRTIVHAVKEVAGAITASTVATVAVFLPIAFVGGMVGELFRPFAFTVSFALAASLLVSLTIVPVLASWFIHPKGETRKERKARKQRAQLEAQGISVGDDAAEPNAPEGAARDSSQHPEHALIADGSEAAIPAGSQGHAEHAAGDHTEDSLVERAVEEKPTRLQRSYLPVIHWTLKRPVVTLIAAVIVFAGTLAATPLMKTNFIGDDEQNAVGLTQTLDPSLSLDSQLVQAKNTEKALDKVDHLEAVQVSIGNSDDGMAAFGAGGDGVISYSITTDPDADQEAIQNDIRQAVHGLKGEFSVGEGGGGVAMDSSIEVAVTAPDSKTLEKANDAVVYELHKHDGLMEVESNLATSRPYLGVSIDRSKAAKYAMSESAVATMVSGAMDPKDIGSIELDDSTVSVYLNEGSKPKDLDAIRDLKIQTPIGEHKVSDVATVKREEGPVSIDTSNGVRQATVTMKAKGDDLTAASAQVQEALDNVKLSGGAKAAIGGVLSDQSEAFSQLGLALLAAILIVYIIMVATFKSLLQPLLLLVSVPFAATGALLLLIATGIPLGVASLIGVLMLVGIVVTNAIVLVDLINQYRERGWSLAEAVETGSSHRFRPIIMTALATILALTPMGLGVTGKGGFISQPLAVVVIGGLLSSTVLTLIVLPTLYYQVEHMREKRREKRAHKRAQKLGLESPAAGGPAVAVAGESVGSQGTQGADTRADTPDETPETPKE